MNHVTLAVAELECGAEALSRIKPDGLHTRREPTFPRGDNLIKLNRRKDQAGKLMLQVIEHAA